MKPVWDERLITREQAWATVAMLAVHASFRDGMVYLDCARCKGAITRLMEVTAVGWPGYLVTMDGLVSAVLRHMVTHHDQSLSGGSDGGSGGTGQARETARGPDPDHDDRGGGHPGHRPVDQTAGAQGGDGAEGGDRG